MSGVSVNCVLRRKPFRAVRSAYDSIDCIGESTRAAVPFSVACPLDIAAMSSRLSTIRRQLCSVIEATRNGNDEEEAVFVSHFPDFNTELLQVIVDLWQDADGAGMDIDSDGDERGGADSSAAGAACTAAELLRISLHTPLAQVTSVLMLHLIQRGTIAGRAAVYCISELRLYILSLGRDASSSSSIISGSSSSGSSGSSSSSNSSSRSISGNVPTDASRAPPLAVLSPSDHLTQLAMLVLFPYTAAAKDALVSTSNPTLLHYMPMLCRGAQEGDGAHSFALDGPLVNACLELLPATVASLALLRRDMRRAGGLDGGTAVAEDAAAKSAKSRSSSSGAIPSKAKGKEKPDLRVLEMLMGSFSGITAADGSTTISASTSGGGGVECVRWSPSNALALCGVVVEVFGRLKGRHLEALERRLYGVIRAATEAHNSHRGAHGEGRAAPGNGFGRYFDYVSFYAGMARLALRLLELSRGPCWVHLLRFCYLCVPEAVLAAVEGLIEQVLLGGDVVVGVVEDWAVAGLRGQAGATDTAKRPSRAAEAARQPELSGAEVLLVEDGVEDEAGAQSTGTDIVAVSAKDLRLLLLISRTHRAASLDAESGGGAFVCIARCVLVVLACCAAAPAPAPGGSHAQAHAHVLVHEPLCDALQLAIDGTTSSAGVVALSQGWLPQARATEAVHLLLVLSSRPDVVLSVLQLLGTGTGPSPHPNPTLLTLTLTLTGPSPHPTAGATVSTSASAYSAVAADAAADTPFPECRMHSAASAHSSVVGAPLRLLARLLRRVFVSQPASRAPLLKLVLQGLLLAGRGDRQTDQGVHKAQARGRAREAPAESMLFYLHCFELLAAQPTLLHPLAPLINQHLPSLLAMPLAPALQPMLFPPLAAAAREPTLVLFGTILTTCRKTMYHGSLPSRAAAVSVLVHLLGTCDGAEVVQAVVAGLSLPVMCRGVLYEGLIALLRVDGGGSNSESSSSSEWVGCRLQLRTLQALLAAVRQRLDRCFAPLSRYTPGGTGDADAASLQGLALVFCPSQCIETYKKLDAGGRNPNHNPNPNPPKLDAGAGAAAMGCSVREDVGRPLVLLLLLEKAVSSRERGAAWWDAALARDVDDIGARLAAMAGVSGGTEGTSLSLTLADGTASGGSSEGSDVDRCASHRYLAGIAAFLSLGCPFSPEQHARTPSPVQTLGAGATSSGTLEAHQEAASVSCMYTALRGLLQCMVLCPCSANTSARTGGASGGMAQRGGGDAARGLVVVLGLLDVVLEVAIGTPALGEGADSVRCHSSLAVAVARMGHVASCCSLEAALGVLRLALGYFHSTQEDAAGGSEATERAERGDRLPLSVQLGALGTACFLVAQAMEGQGHGLGRADQPAADSSVWGSQTAEVLPLLLAAYEATSGDACLALILRAARDAVRCGRRPASSLGDCADSSDEDDDDVPGRDTDSDDDDVDKSTAASRGQAGKTRLRAVLAGVLTQPLLALPAGLSRRLERWDVSGLQGGRIRSLLGHLTRSYFDPSAGQGGSSGADAGAVGPGEGLQEQGQEQEQRQGHEDPVLLQVMRTGRGRRLVKAVEEAAWMVLYGCRTEVMRALALAAQGLGSGSTAGLPRNLLEASPRDLPTQANPHPHASGILLVLNLRFAKDLYTSILGGLPTSLCLAYLQLLRGLVSALPVPSTAHYDEAVRRIEAREASAVSQASLDPGTLALEQATGQLAAASMLWHILPHLDTSNARLLSVILALALRLGGFHQGLEQCERLMRCSAGAGADSDADAPHALQDGSLDSNPDKALDDDSDREYRGEWRQRGRMGRAVSGGNEASPQDAAAMAVPSSMTLLRLPRHVAGEPAPAAASDPNPTPNPNPNANPNHTLGHLPPQTLPPPVFSGLWGAMRISPRARDFILGEVFRVLDAALRGALAGDGPGGGGGTTAGTATATAAAATATGGVASTVGSTGSAASTAAFTAAPSITGVLDKSLGLGCFGIAAGTEAAVVRAVCRCLFNLYSRRDAEVTMPALCPPEGSAGNALSSSSASSAYPAAPAPAPSPALLMDSLQSTRQAAALTLTGRLLTRACADMASLHALLGKLLAQDKSRGRRRSVLAWEEDDKDEAEEGSAGAPVGAPVGVLGGIPADGAAGDSGKEGSLGSFHADKAAQLEVLAAKQQQQQQQQEESSRYASLLALLLVPPSLLCAAKAWLAAPTAASPAPKRKDKDKSPRGPSSGAAAADSLLIRGAPSPNPARGGVTMRTATADKKAQSVLFRIDEVHWQLGRLAELCERCRAAGLDLGPVAAAEVARAVLDQGAGILQALTQAEARKRSRKNSRGVARMSGAAAGDSGSESGSGSGGDGEAERSADKRAGRQAPRKRLRSRNKVVDRWLGEEGGADSYADLEDFLV